MKRLLSPVADAVHAYVVQHPGATVRDVADALFPNHANNGVPAAQGSLSWLMARRRIVRESFGPNIAARYTARTERAVCASINVNGVSLARAPWEKIA